MQRAIDSLRLHPDAERVPMASSEDLRNLRASLKEHGQQDPIDITPDDTILDGRTRWTLLRDLGAQTVQVRVIDIPDGDQIIPYIVGRAVNRRHLTSEQKRDLNGWLRTVVVEVTEHPKTGEEMRIGISRPERAAKLGVSAEAVKKWDNEDVGKSTQISPTEPTHIRRSGGNPTPYPIHPTPRVEPRERHERPAPLRKSRPIPAWSRHFSMWCRSARPEDRDFLRRIEREIHEALTRNGMECKGEKTA